MARAFAELRGGGARGIAQAVCLCLAARAFRVRVAQSLDFRARLLATRNHLGLGAAVFAHQVVQQGKPLLDRLAVARGLADPLLPAA